MKKCPFCAEDIQDEAIKCRYCGEFLNQTRGTSKPKSLLKWYYQPHSIIIGFCVVGPFVLPVVWKHPKYSFLKKVIISAIILILSYAILRVFLWALDQIQGYYQMLGI